MWVSFERASSFIAGDTQAEWAQKPKNSFNMNRLLRLGTVTSIGSPFIVVSPVARRYTGDLTCVDDERVVRLG